MPHVDRDEVAITGGVAIRMGLEAIGERGARATIADLDLVSKRAAGEHAAGSWTHMNKFTRQSLAASVVLLLSAVCSMAAAAQSRVVKTPAWARTAIRSAPFGSRIAITAWLEPSIQQADFDGDGKADIAVLVRERSSGKVGIVVVHRGSKQAFLIAAGTRLSNGGDNGGDDFSWMDRWQILTGPAEQGSTEEPPPRLRGAALWVEKVGSGSALVYWTGKRYAWYQQGD